MPALGRCCTGDTQLNTPHNTAGTPQAMGEPLWLWQGHGVKGHSWVFSSPVTSELRELLHLQKRWEGAVVVTGVEHWLWSLLNSPKSQWLECSALPRAGV